MFSYSPPDTTQTLIKSLNKNSDLQSQLLIELRLHSLMIAQMSNVQDVDAIRNDLSKNSTSGN